MEILRRSYFDIRRKMRGKKTTRMRATCLVTGRKTWIGAGPQKTRSRMWWSGHSRGRKGIERERACEPCREAAATHRACVRRCSGSNNPRTSRVVMIMMVVMMMIGDRGRDSVNIRLAVLTIICRSGPTLIAISVLAHIWSMDQRNHTSRAADCCCARKSDRWARGLLLELPSDACTQKQPHENPSILK